MFNKTEKEERQYLDEVKEKLKSVLRRIDENVNSYAKELQEQKEYLWENKAGMDHAEKVSVRQSVTQTSLTGETAIERKKRLQKLLGSPYFGRFDFIEEGESELFPVYIGIHAFFDESQNTNIIHDWRAPISNMYYDFELGKVNYDAPSGNISGEITLKRQYRIREGQMEFMLESSVNIHDDILQTELSKASDDRMKNIVATIQCDQNAIIRNETSSVLIIQGVAGSGKTSIALHRVAFLLYRFKENIASDDILILSPNKVFADYISNVLPELGEDRIPEMGMEDLAAEVLEKKFRFQTFFEQVNQLLEKNDEAFRNRIQIKASSDFLNKLNEYVTYVDANYFKATDLIVKRYPVPAWFIEERFRAYHRVPVFKRFNEVSKDIEGNVLLYYKYEINGKERNEIRKSVRNMFKITNLRELYKDFFIWMGYPELFKPGARSSYEYSDIFPLIYLKIRLEGAKNYHQVKHLLVDEMQDYTPVQYAVLSKLFACKMTILGDANQSVNPYSSSTAEEILKIFPQADLVKLCKSYRSTYEITRFAQQITVDDDLEMVERHGEPPEIKHFNSPEDEVVEIKKLISGFRDSGYKSLGIICKTQKQAEILFEKLTESYSQVHLLSAQSASFTNGIMITTIHMAKGLEFDQVIIPYVSLENFNTEMDRHLLYIACTRAMHNLVLTYSSKQSEFLKK